MEYDIAGNQKKLIDPSAGTINYTYNGYGELVTQQNARSQTTTIVYNADGTIKRKETPEGLIKYRYSPNKQLVNVNSYGTVSHTYSYDSKGRVISVIDTIPGTTPLTTSYSYDSYGRMSTFTHPSGIIETNNYNGNGYLSSISAGGSTRWTTSSMNARGQVTAGLYGSDLSATYGFDAYGYPTSTITGTLQSYSYNFNTVTGNLNWRQNNKYTGLKETFNYDNSDRLDNVYQGTGTPVLTLDMAYDSNKGGITTKSDAGTMFYNTSGKPYRLSGISPTTGLVPSNSQSITYTSFESVSTISENNYVASFTYNPEAQRAKMVVQQSGNTILTRWYSGSSYVKETAGGVTKQYTFIGGDAYTAPVVAIKTGTGTPVYYYLLRDHLGSITHVVNTSKTTVAEYSYDAWGRMRNPTNWTNYAPGTEPALFVAGRGFTGHEHLPWFNSINMNGRVYDPLIGQFLSPDNYVQDPTFTQNYNRYTYCLNNPLSYKDPSGMLRETLPNPADAGHPYNPEAAAWLANYYMNWDYNYGGGGGGGGGGGRYAGGHHVGTMGSGYYDVGDYTMDDLMGSLWHATPNNAYYTFTNVNSDWYHTSTTTITFKGTDPSTLTASLAGNGIAWQEGNISIYFDGSRIFIIDESKGSGLYNTVAYSGRSLKNGSFDYSVERQKLKDKGPIPEGNYTLDVNQIQEISFIDRIAGLIDMGGWPGSTFAWGDTRAWLTPTIWTETYGRSGFSIHGGVTPGSAGCIDLVGNSGAFFNQLQNVVGGQQQIIIRVRYK